MVPIRARKWAWFCTLIALLFLWKRKPLMTFLRRAARLATSTVEASDRLSATLKAAALDLRTYVQAPPAIPPNAHHLQAMASQSVPTGGGAPQQMPSRRGSYGRRISSGAAANALSVSSMSVSGGLSVSGGTGTDEEVPRSVRRLLRVLATPESASIIRNIAAGASQGVVQEATRDWDQLEVRQPSAEGATASSTTGVAVPQPLAAKLMYALNTPGGQKFAVLVLTNIVREGLHVVFDRMEQTELRRSRVRRETGSEEQQGVHSMTETPSPIVRALLEAGLSPDGRKLFSELASAVTCAALPIVLQESEKKRTHDAQDGTQNAAAQSGSRAPSDLGVLNFLGQKALQDKQFMKEIAQSISAEVVRSYLTTKHDLRSNAKRSTRTVSCASSQCVSRVPRPPNHIHAEYHSDQESSSTSNGNTSPTVPLPCACEPGPSRLSSDLAFDSRPALWNLALQVAKGKVREWLQGDLTRRQPSYLFM
ncbi:hypothetical protein FVE85_1936 [Porphyridium purpureum]|uniref:Uncharacterized protein n=1 Tax=Porphyridium purpureum TaxID=35688 RepID=A0A5J4YW84_PORPP|nr:hypothetical protein FVE85_1936 [Porphyridium purpureum]|eukprot:POR5072..scf209_3